MYKEFSKYHAIKTEYNGRTYDSKKEAAHAATLDMMRLATDEKLRVRGVQPQVRFDLTVKGKKIGVYIADFVVVFADGHSEIQDVKGVLTPLYKWKKKHFEAQYGEKIIEI
jgi:hypothetical protein